MDELLGVDQTLLSESSKPLLVEVTRDGSSFYITATLMKVEIGKSKSVTSRS